MKRKLCLTPSPFPCNFLWLLQSFIIHFLSLFLSPLTLPTPDAFAYSLALTHGTPSGGGRRLFWWAWGDRGYCVWCGNQSVTVFSDQCGEQKSGLPLHMALSLPTFNDQNPNVQQPSLPGLPCPCVLHMQHACQKEEKVAFREEGLPSSCSWPSEAPILSFHLISLPSPSQKAACLAFVWWGGSVTVR